MFDLEVSYPPIEPPHYLLALNPGVFEAEQARVRERFEAAVKMAGVGAVRDATRGVTGGESLPAAIVDLNGPDRWLATSAEPHRPTLSRV